MATHRDKDRDDLQRTGDVLGIGPDVSPDPSAPRGENPNRRRRADDIVQRETADRDPVGGPDAPPGLHVED
jgi:hypothetical protein